MAVIRLPQPYTVSWAAKNTREALASLGEECVILHTYHINEDLDTRSRCQNFNPIYKQEDHWNCVYCFGTTFQGGVKEVWRAWGIFTDKPIDEKYAKTGEWEPDNRSVQIENEPTLIRHDFIARVARWDNTHSPIAFGDRYVIDVVRELTIRTGNVYGQPPDGSQKYGQSANLHRLPDNHPIQNYVIPSGIPIPRVDGLPR